MQKYINNENKSPSNFYKVSHPTPAPHYRMDMYYCIPFPCVHVPSMCTYAEPQGNGQEGGPS